MSFNGGRLDSPRTPRRRRTALPRGTERPLTHAAPGAPPGGVRGRPMPKSQVLRDSTCRTFSEPTTTVMKGVATRSRGRVGDGEVWGANEPVHLSQSSGKEMGQRGPCGGVTTSLPAAPGDAGRLNTCVPAHRHADGACSWWALGKRHASHCATLVSSSWLCPRRCIDVTALQDTRRREQGSWVLFLATAYDQKKKTNDIKN